jgi:hypothetical protein
MRRVRFLRSASVAGALLLAAAGCGGGGGGGEGDGTDPVVVPTTEVGPATPPTSGRPTVLAIVTPATGDQVAGNVVRLDLTGSGITIVPADGDTSGATGHYHVFVDRDAVEPGEVIPVAAGIIHTAEEPIVIPGLAVGPHRVLVVYGDGAHRRLGVTEAGTSFTVTGPSIDASTPPNAPAGEPVTVTVAAEGLSPDGHLHVFVDREPTPAGQPVPDEPGIIHAPGPTVAVPDLAPGPHTIWVVAGDAAHLPLDPPVMDKVTVTVG